MGQAHPPDGDPQHDIRQYWDDMAASFDTEPDHGLRDPQARRAWTDLLRTWMPNGPQTVLDVGCGTGSLSVILAELGHTVTGIDVSPNMIAQAEAKARAQGCDIPFHVMDAASPRFEPGTFDVVLCRHVLWALPDPAQALRHWADLLAAPGRLMLIEGFWHTGAGLHAADVEAALPEGITVRSVQDLAANPAYWGKTVSDERYAVIADLER
ncbi:MAG TPA: methyltransferase domain-containing protein [Aggregatilinea sp.]|uniref:class I SAM-dependent methyltransferase n=1 Tax=Aggregatilinea sp. TaxID=2806333 RepID=UPI002C78BAF3|nr:methyltransferase domain-containing protein [Aggregatilinea sp.]HML24552.1 methyltransferase domain-containing protein [Aggregatilinea sp.]